MVHVVPAFRRKQLGECLKLCMLALRHDWCLPPLYCPGRVGLMPALPRLCLQELARTSGSLSLAREQIELLQKERDELKSRWGGQKEWAGTEGGTNMA